MWREVNPTAKVCTSAVAVHTSCGCDIIRKWLDDKKLGLL